MLPPLRADEMKSPKATSAITNSQKFSNRNARNDGESEWRIVSFGPRCSWTSSWGQEQTLADRG